MLIGFAQFASIAAFKCFVSSTPSLQRQESLQMKRCRRQRFIWRLSCLCSDGVDETKHLKAAIDANCAKPISIEDCAAMIVRSYAVIPKLARTLDDGRTAYG